MVLTVFRTVYDIAAAEDLTLARAFVCLLISSPGVSDRGGKVLDDQGAQFG
jgi:hypothetical protein